MHYLSILYSKSSQKFYIGETNNIEERILNTIITPIPIRLLRLLMIGKLFWLLAAITEKKLYILKVLLKEWKAKPLTTK